MYNNGYLQGTFLSGLIISFVSYGYVMMNASILGAILFAFGLMSIIFYELHLFTGDAGFVMDEIDNENLFITLLGNFLGCLIGSLLLSATLNGDAAEFIDKALSLREINTWSDIWKVFVKAIGCGLILTISVKFAREARKERDMVKILPLLFGIPLFLMSGFFHCIVDIFYLTCGAIWTDRFYYGVEDAMPSIIGWVIVVIGNLIGCNLPRIIMRNKKF
ncbi:MAG: formate/nitrite transporter family protein [Lachnospiraceae bacterium]|nr:formate/nitrite transporter family protein [Lachnospiraceae bacterium]